MDDVRTAIVTGSSSGIGRAIALRLLQSSFRVVLNYSEDDHRAARTLAACQQVSEHVIMVKADVSRAEDAAQLIQRTLDDFGGLDVLVNNAARVIDKPILEMSEHEWDQVLDVNLKGPFLCSKLAAPHMLNQEGGGVIINIGASTGIRARPNGANTCSSKAGLMLLTQCLAIELGPKVRVNTIVPGLTVTPETELRFHLDDPSIRTSRESLVPLKRLGLPQDIADAVLMLLSPQARYITGQRIFVDGGQYMW